MSSDGHITITTAEDVDMSSIYTTEKEYFIFLIPFVMISSSVCPHFTFLYSDFLLPSHYMVGSSYVSLQSAIVCTTD